MKAFNILIIILLSQILTPVFSQEKLLCASCIAGKGCSFFIGPERSDIDVTMGYEGVAENAPDGSIFVISTARSGTNYYLESQLSMAELDRLYGGDGFTQILMGYPGIQPLDGEWQVTTGELIGEGCVIDGADYKPAILGQLKSIGKTMANGNISFQYPFEASQFLPSNKIKWMMIAPNTYKGILSGIPGGAMGFHFIIRVKSEKIIEGEGIVKVQIPGQEACIFKIPIQYKLLKANELPEVNKQ